MGCSGRKVLGDENMLQVANIQKSFGNHQVLKDISLQVGDGEVTTLIGPSGTGKSTLLRTINLLDRADAGTVTLDGDKIDPTTKDHHKILSFRRHPATVFQQYNLFQNMTILKNIVQPQVLIKGINKEEAEQRAHKLLNKFGLAQFANQYPNRLSGGQQQRASIVRALAMKPKLMLLDEPTSALDPELTAEVLDIIRKVAQSGIMTILATHEMQFAREVSDNVIFMEQGVVVEQGKPKQLFDHPQQERTHQFLAHFGMK